MKRYFVKKIMIVAAGICSIVLGFGCKKHEKLTDTLTLEISHTVDGKSLQWDNLLYKNQAGNLYSIERLQYYISDICFYANKKTVLEVDTAIYIDARMQEKKHIELYNFPLGNIDSVSFLIGVSPRYNTPGGLPPTMENTIMAWPEMMGGGYHFMKLEGRWEDEAQTPGFAMHLGKPGFQVSAGMRCAYNLKENNAGPFRMTMNINEWFYNPNTYNFSTDGVYSMGNEALMLKLKENGADVFSQY